MHASIAQSVCDLTPMLARDIMAKKRMGSANSIRIEIGLFMLLHVLMAQFVCGIVCAFYI